jgi:glycosyltransferase involved in cell wall biosynthesis
LVVRCLDSIPRRDDIEVIARDDASTDNTRGVLLKYKKEHPDLNLRVYWDDVNHGCFYNANRTRKLATGEYFHYLDNDDYLYTAEYERAMRQLNGEDIVFFNLRINSGFNFVLNEKTRVDLCSPISRFIRREFAEGIQFSEARRADCDYQFNLDLLARNPVCKYTDITAYHYNFPREGSLYDLMVKGLL